MQGSERWAATDRVELSRRSYVRRGGGSRVSDDDDGLPVTGLTLTMSSGADSGLPWVAEVLVAAPSPSPSPGPAPPPELPFCQSLLVSPKVGRVGAALFANGVSASAAGLFLLAFVLYKRRRARAGDVNALSSLILPVCKLWWSSAGSATLERW